MKSVAEDSDTAEALRAVADKIKDDRNDFVVISGDLVTDVSLKVSPCMHTRQMSWSKPSCKAENNKWCESFSCTSISSKQMCIWLGPKLLIPCVVMQ